MSAQSNLETTAPGVSGALALRRTLAALARPSQPVRHAIRYGTAASISLWIVFAYELPQHTWPLITVLMVCQPESGGSVRKAFLRILGTVAAALVSIPLIGMFAQQPPMMLASMFAVWTIGAYGMTGPRNQYAWNVFGFTSGIILMAALTSTDQVETLAFERAAMVALGIVITLFVDSLLWPDSADEQLRTALAERVRNGAASMKAALAVPRPGHTETPPAPPASNLQQRLDLVDQAANELGATRHHTEILSRTTLLVAVLSLRVQHLHARIAEHSRAVDSSTQSLLEDFAVSFSDAAERTAHGLTSNGPTTSAAAELRRRFEQLEKHRLEKLGDRSSARPTASSSEPLAAVALRSALAPILRDLVTGFEQLESAVAELASPEPEPASESPRTARPPRSTDAGPVARLVERLRFDPDRVEIALRSGIAAATIVMIMLGLGWAPNSLAATVTYILAASPTRGGLRMAAVGITAVVLLSWALADFFIVFLVPHLPRMPVSLLLPFGVAATFAYIGARVPKAAGLTPLLTLIVLLAIFGGSVAPDNVAGSYSTTTYLLLGVIVAVLAQSLLWPRRASAMFLGLATQQLQLCAQAIEKLRSDDAAGPGEETVTFFGQFAAGTARLAQLGGQAHLEADETPQSAELRSDLLANLQTLAEAVIHAQRAAVAHVEHDARAFTPLAAAVQRLDEALGESLAATVAALRGEATAPGAELASARDAVRAILDAPETRDAARVMTDAARIDRGLATVDAHYQLASAQLQIEAWLERWRHSTGQDAS